jgi:hypothetical protein
MIILSKEAKYFVHQSMDSSSSSESSFKELASLISLLLMSFFAGETGLQVPWKCQNKLLIIFFFVSYTYSREMRVSFEFSNGESSTAGKPFSVTIFLLSFVSNSWSSGNYGLHFIPNLMQSYPRSHAVFLF